MPWILPAVDALLKAFSVLQVFSLEVPRITISKAAELAGLPSIVGGSIWA